MPPSSSAIVVTGTPITSSLGVGAVQGNTLTISGLTLQPSAPGWRLSQSDVGEGFAHGVWSFGPVPVVAPRSGITDVPGLTSRVTKSGGGGGGGGTTEDYYGSNEVAPPAQGSSIPLASWAVLLLIVVAATSKG